VCVNCVVSVTTFALPILVGGAGVLHARLRRTDEPPEPIAAPVESEGRPVAQSGHTADG